MSFFDLPPRTDARLTLHGYPGAERLSWSLLIIKHDARGVPDARLIDYGVVRPETLPEDLLAALWETLTGAVHPDA